MLQKSNSVRDVASVPKQQSGFQDLLPANRGLGLSQKRRQSDRKQPYLYETGQGSQRKLLVEKDMPGHCLSHKTSVAAGALMMYLRFLIDPGPLDLYSPHNFFPDASRGLLRNSKSNKDAVNLFGSQDFADGQGDLVKVEGGGLNQQVFDGIGVNQQDQEGRNGVGDDGEEDEEEEEEEDEDEDYGDKEELYPDTRQEAGHQQERKVVHFGANDHPPHGGQDEDYLDNREDEKDEYADDDNNEEEEGDYIKRVKGDDNGVAQTLEKDNIDEDTEYTYYDDDDDDADRGIIKRHKPQEPPQKGARIRAHNRHKPHPVNMDKVPMGLSDSPPTKTVVVLLSATSLLLIIFMYRFIRKRRIHFRHTSRGFFKL